MVQATDFADWHNVSQLRRLDRPPVRRILGEGEVGPSAVVVLEVPGEECRTRRRWWARMTRTKSTRKRALPPPGPDAGEPDPEEPVRRTRLRPSRRSLVDGELLAQGEVLDFPTPNRDEQAVGINDRGLIRTQHGHRPRHRRGDRARPGRRRRSHGRGARDGQLGGARLGRPERRRAGLRALAAFPPWLRTPRRDWRARRGGSPERLPDGPTRLKSARLRLAARLKAEGLSNRAVAQRIGVSENAVRKLLRRLGWRPATGTQAGLPLAPPSAHPNLSAFYIPEDRKGTVAAPGPKASTVKPSSACALSPPLPHRSVRKSHPLGSRVNADIPCSRCGALIHYPSTKLRPTGSAQEAGSG